MAMNIPTQQFRDRGGDDELNKALWRIEDELIRLKSTHAALQQHRKRLCSLNECVRRDLVDCWSETLDAGFPNSTE